MNAVVPIGVSRRRLAVLFLGGLACGVVVAALSIGQIRSRHIDASGVRLVSGCVSTVDITSAGQYRLSIEQSGPALHGGSTCRDVPDGTRDGSIDSVIIHAESGASVRVEANENGTPRSSDGGERVTIGAVAFDVPGVYTIDIEGEGVIVIGADPEMVLRNSYWWTAISALIAIVCFAVSPVMGRRASRRAPILGEIDWSAPDATTRVG